MERGESNFKLRIQFEEEDMSPAEETKTVSCLFSLDTSKSSMVTSQMMNHMFETIVYIRLPRVFLQKSVGGGYGSPSGTMLYRFSQKLKRLCPRRSTASWIELDNASVEMT